MGDENRNSQNKTNLRSPQESQGAIPKKQRTNTSEEGLIISMLHEFRAEMREEIRNIKTGIEKEKQAREEMERERERREEEREERWSREMSIIKGELEFCKTKIQQLENKERRKNIIVRGIEEKEYERRDETEGKVQEMCKKLGLTGMKMNSVRRVGEKREGRSRPILIEMNDISEKYRIQKERYKLKGTKVYLDEDLNREERLRAGKLWKISKEKRNEGMRTKIRGGKIWIEDTLYEMEEDEQGTAQLIEVKRKKKNETKNGRGRQL